MGRRSLYTPELADELLRRLSGGEPLAQICRDEHMPSVSTVSDWKKAHPDFAERFGTARDEGFDEIAVDTLQIIDEEPERAQTKWGDQVDSGYVAWQKNRVEQRLKLLAKWDPRRYGEKLAMEHSGELTVNGLAGRMRGRRAPPQQDVEDLV